MEWLNKKVRYIFTGFEGVVTAVAIYANGNQSVLIEAVDRSGRPVELWTDVKSIEEVKEQEG